MGLARKAAEAIERKLAKKPAPETDETSAEISEVKEVRAETKKSVFRIDGSRIEKFLFPEQQETLLSTLKSRFHDTEHMKLHEKVLWSEVEKALQAYPEKLWSLQQLEATGGEPDVLGEEDGEFVFGDCSAESPSGRRNFVFDKEAEEYLKNHYPDEKCGGNASDMVKEIGIDFMDEAQYRALQEKLSVDKNSWSWLKTPADIRKTGYALYGCRLGDYVVVNQHQVNNRHGDCSFRAALRVLKA